MSVVVYMLTCIVRKRKLDPYTIAQNVTAMFLPPEVQRAQDKYNTAETSSLNSHDEQLKFWK